MDELESEEFYELMQEYRIAPVQCQDIVIIKFEAVKDWIRCFKETQ